MIVLITLNIIKFDTKRKKKKTTAELLQQDVTSLRLNLPSHYLPVDHAYFLYNIQH